MTHSAEYQHPPPPFYLSLKFYPRAITRKKIGEESFDEVDG